MVKVPPRFHKTQYPCLFIALSALRFAMFYLTFVGAFKTRNLFEIILTSLQFDDFGCDRRVGAARAFATIYICNEQTSEIHSRNTTFSSGMAFLHTHENTR